MLIVLYRCCSNFLCPPDFVFEKEQKIKVCNECYGKAQAYLKDKQTMPDKSFYFQSVVSSIISEDTKESSLAALTRRAHELSDNALEHLLREENVFDEWYGILRTLTKECLELVQANITYIDDLDINKYVKVKKILHKDQSLTQIVRGVVTRRSNTSRKMKSQFSNPNILMIKGDLDHPVDEITVADASSLESEVAFFEGIVNKVCELKPQVLIIEGRIHRTIYEALTKSEITIITKLRETQFNRIAESLGAIPLQGVKKLLSVNSSVLRSCENFKVVDFQEDKDPKNETSKSTDSILMFFESCMVKKNITLLLSGSDVPALVKVKKCLKKFFPILRTLILEIGVIYQETYIFNSQKKICSQENKKTSINVEEDLQPKVPIQSKFTIQSYLLQKRKGIKFLLS